METKVCPKGGSGDYTFRSRKKIEDSVGQPDQVPLQDLRTRVEGEGNWTFTRQRSKIGSSR